MLPLSQELSMRLSMKYINTKTKAVIETACLINGGDWKPIEKKKEETKKTSQSRKSIKKEA